MSEANHDILTLIARGRLEVIARLLGAGSDPVYRNKWGVSAAEIIGLLEARSK